LSYKRQDPPLVADEQTMLSAWLEYHRLTLYRKCMDLSHDSLVKRAVPPSKLSLLGLIRHMTDVECFWFRRILAGDDGPLLYSSDANPDGDFNDTESIDFQNAIKLWQAECSHSSEVIKRSSSLEEVGRQTIRGNQVSVRWVMLHMIEEYARHNGHADLLRECIDGVTGT
jgi:uncharacterized damage-inducible protein DinB